jgi:membrane protein
VGALIARVKAIVAAARLRYGVVDHAFRAVSRFGDEGGSRLAASVTLPGFLAFFPLLALAFAVLGFTVSSNVGAQRDVLHGVSNYFPGLLCSSAVHQYACAGTSQIDVAKLQGARNAATAIGVVGLLLAGLGWVDALRTAVRLVFHSSTRTGFVLLSKARDVGILLGLGVGLAVSLGVAGLANSATGWLLRGVHIDGVVAAGVVKLIGIVVSIGVDLVLFSWLFGVLAQPDRPRRAVRSGSVVAAVGFELLQIVGASYLRHTTGNALYGSFAVLIGLLVWINLVVRFTLFAAAWTVTERPETLLRDELEQDLISVAARDDSPAHARSAPVAGPAVPPWPAPPPGVAGPPTSRH